jgi:uncharacterized membrane protein
MLIFPDETNYRVIVKQGETMKHLETIKGFIRNKQLLLMYTSFVYGGVCFALFFQEAFAVLAFQSRPFSNMTFIENESHEWINGSSPNDSPRDFRMRSFSSPFSSINPSMLLFYLFGGTFAIANGIFLHKSIDKKKEIKSKFSVMEKLLTKEEKRIVELLRDGNGEVLQSEITRNLSLSRLKVHRILTRLEKKGIIEKHPYGMTNKIFLK